MSKSDKFSAFLGALGVAVTFLLGGTFWGVVACVVAALLLRMFLTHAEPPEAPEIVFHEVHHGPIRLGDIQGRDPTIDVWELWFVNRPMRNTPNATARHLKALVQFCDDAWAVRMEVVGQWIKSKEPQHRGWIERMDAIDLSPGFGDWGKLLIVGQSDIETEHISWSGETKRSRWIYALAGENFHHRPMTVDHDPYLLAGEITRVRVKLNAENLDDIVFDFAIGRSEDGAIREIRRLP